MKKEKTKKILESISAIVVAVLVLLVCAKGFDILVLEEDRECRGAGYEYQSSRYENAHWNSDYIEVREGFNYCCNRIFENNIVINESCEAVFVGE